MLFLGLASIQAMVIHVASLSHKPLLNDLIFLSLVSPPGVLLHLQRKFPQEKSPVIVNECTV